MSCRSHLTAIRHTYYLAIFSLLRMTRRITISRLIDVAQSPAQALTFDTTVNGTNDPFRSASVYRFAGTNVSGCSLILLPANYPGVRLSICMDRKTNS